MRKIFIYSAVVTVAIIAFVGCHLSTTSSLGLINIQKPTVEVVKIGEKYQLIRNGEPYFIKGAGTFVNLKDVKAFGGNSIRVWDTSDATRILDEAHELGLTVNLGIWITRQREGFSFYNNKLLEDELKRIKDIVNRFKDHPALLMWSIGNEMSAGNPGIRMWDTLNKIAQLIHELDPNHPVSTPLFSVNIDQLKVIKKRCPDIDFISFNVYGSLVSVSQELEAVGWDKPYLISEYGAKGYWESPQTSWGEPFEQNTTQKAEFIKERYAQFITDVDACLGSYIFFWGYKMEKTHTWFSLMNEEGLKTEAIDILHYNWENKWPDNRAPKIVNFGTVGYGNEESICLKPGEIGETFVKAFDFEGDLLAYKWEILKETTLKDGSIEKQRKPRPLKNLILTNGGDRVQWKAPEKTGAYRLFVTIYDGNGNVASANVPFYVGNPQENTSFNVFSLLGTCFSNLF